MNMVLLFIDRNTPSGCEEDAVIQGFALVENNKIVKAKILKGSTFRRGPATILTHKNKAQLYKCYAIYCEHPDYVDIDPSLLDTVGILQSE